MKGFTQGYLDLNLSEVLHCMAQMAYMACMAGCLTQSRCKTTRDNLIKRAAP